MSYIYGRQGRDRWRVSEGEAPGLREAPKQKQKLGSARASGDLARSRKQRFENQDAAAARAQVCVRSRLELDARLRLRGRTRHGDKTRDRDLRLPFCGCAHTHWYSLGAARRLARACGFVRKGFLQVYDREVACTHRLARRPAAWNRAASIGVHRPRGTRPTAIFLASHKCPRHRRRASTALRESQRAVSCRVLETHPLRSARAKLFELV